MGLIYTDLTLGNARRDDLAPISVRARVDSGALHLCLPAHVATQLGLEEMDRREVTTADGKSLTVPYVGPVTVRFENRRCLVGALVMGDEALLGAIPMEDMDILVDPPRQRVMVNPKSPNIPMSVAKALPQPVTRMR